MKTYLIIGALCLLTGLFTILRTDPAAAKEKVPEPDSVKILARYDFEDGLQGWSREEWAQYKPWNEVTLVKTNTFQGSKHSLKTTVPNTWKSLGPLVNFKFRDAGTKISFAYYGHHCNSVTVQAWNVDHDKNMHFTYQPYRDREWQIGTVDVAKFITWGGNSPSAAGDQFRTVMIYAGCDMKYSDHFFLIDNVVVYTGTDRKPPEAVTGLTGGIDWKQGLVRLKWTVPADNVGAVLFKVYRGTREDFQPIPRLRIASNSGNICSDTSVPNFGTFYYKVVAQDHAGNHSPVSKALKMKIVE